MPTFAGGMFEGLMANLVVPETTLGSAQLRARRPALGAGPGALRQQALHFPVFGLSPSSTADDTGNYGGFGVEGQKFAADQGLAVCTTCATETTVSPHASAIALPVTPKQAYANLQTLRTQFPGVYTADGGFFDAVNPMTGQVGHRRLVLDQSMIMAALDDILRGGGLQRYFARDPMAFAAKLYLGLEHMRL